MSLSSFFASSAVEALVSIDDSIAGSFFCALLLQPAKQADNINMTANTTTFSLIYSLQTSINYRALLVF
jgi:hypothetical protein